MQVASALIDGSLDFAYGSGPLTSEDYKRLRDEHADKLLARLSSHRLNTRAIVINSGKAPTNSENVRMVRSKQESIHGKEQHVHGKGQARVHPWLALSMCSTMGPRRCKE